MEAVLYVLSDGECCGVRVVAVHEQVLLHQVQVTSQRQVLVEEQQVLRDALQHRRK